jgi:cytochrome c oxidase assembly protein subunit 15
MSVPDWPTSYGYNMFLFPWSRMEGPIFLEHSHRLVASGIGFLTLILAGWIWAVDRRPWLRWLSLVAVLAVIAQGVLGGLRVVLYKDELGIFHAALAHAFLALTGFIALATSRWWKSEKFQISNFKFQISPRLPLLACGLIYLQLILGATMRHQHAGLAVPDFPKAYGQWWPALSASELEHVNQERLAAGQPPTTKAQIHVHMTHRIGAVVTFVTVILAGMSLVAGENVPTLLRRSALAWMGLVGLQVVLGMVTIWSNKAADIATAHAVGGALLFLGGVLISAMLLRLREFSSAPVSEQKSPALEVAHP